MPLTFNEDNLIPDMVIGVLKGNVKAELRKLRAENTTVFHRASAHTSPGIGSSEYKCVTIGTTANNAEKV